MDYVYLKAFGVCFVVVCLLAGVLYWIITFVKKVNHRVKYFIKFKIFRKKHNENDIIELLKYYDKRMTIDDVHKHLLIKTKKSFGKIRELLYIYSEMINLKGGMKK